MTHGQTPTATCQATRAVRLALAEANGPAELKQILERARRWRPQLGPERVTRVLERLFRDGEVRLVAPGVWTYTAPTKARDRDDNRLQRGGWA